MVLFKKETTITKDTIASEYMRDMYEGGATTANIVGGFKAKNYLFNATIPTKPVFGSAELKELETHIYTDSITVGERRSRYPNLASYLFKEDIELTEGFMSPIDSEDLVVFSGNLDGFCSLQDEFNGDGYSGLNGTKTIIKKGTATVQSVDTYYALASDVLDHAVSKYGMWTGSTTGWNNCTYDDILRQHGRTADQMGIKDAATVLGFTPSPKGNHSNQFVKLGPESTTSLGRKRRQILPNESHPGVSRELYMNEEFWRVTNEIVIENESGKDEDKTIATPLNTIFDMVRGVQTFETKDDPAKLNAEGVARLDTKNSLTQGQSLELSTFWTGDSTRKATVSYPSFNIPGYVNADGTASGAANRQEICLVKKNLPFPIRMPVNPTSTHATSNTFDNAENGSSIELDVNFAQISKTYQYESSHTCVSSDGSSSTARVSQDNFLTLHRGFHIVFADTPPEENETLFDYVIRLKGGSTKGGGVDTDHYVDQYKRTDVDFDGSTGGGNEDTMWAVRAGDQDHVYAGVSFLNINRGLASDVDEGVVALPWNGVLGEDSPQFDRAANGLYISDHEMSDEDGNPLSVLGFFAANDNGTGNSSNATQGVFGDAAANSLGKKLIPMENTWQRITFAVSPASSVRADSADGQTTHSSALAKGHYSFGRMYISDISDGKRHELRYGGDRHLDIGLIGEHGGFKSYSDEFSDVTGTADDIDNWPQNMSIWVTNYPNEYEANKKDTALGVDSSDTAVKVFLDAIRFKDFNFAAANSTQISENKPSSAIAVAAGQGILVPDAADNDSNFSEFISSRYGPTPSIMCFGLSQQAYLGDNNVTGSNKDYSWTRWPYAFWLNNFSCDNISAMGNIPDSHIMFQHSVPFHGSNTGDELELGNNFGQDGLDDSQTKVGPTNLNGNGNTAACTSYLSTDLIVATHDGDVGSAGTTSQVVTAANSDNSSAAIPVRKGDVIRFSSDENGDKTVTSVTGSIASGLTINMSGTMSTTTVDEHILVKKENLIDNFTQKGGFMTWKNASGTYAAIKRENIFASARILDVISQTATTCTLRVDTILPFKLKNDQEYIAYLYGAKATYDDGTAPTEIASNSANVKTGIKVVAKDYDKNEVTLAWDGTDNGGSTALLTYDNIYRLFISPYNYWTSIITNVSDSSGVTLPARYYSNAMLLNNNWTDSSSNKRAFDGEGISTSITNDFVDEDVTNRRGVGTTFNEFLFNDSTSGGIPGAYINKWNIEPSADHSFLNIQDYGFGDFSNETQTGGHTSEILAIDSQYNILRMKNVIGPANLKPNQDVTFAVNYKEADIDHEMTIQTRENSSNPPKFVAVFEDEIPSNPVLSVGPSEEDAFFPEFKWEVKDDDLWYGLLQITKEPQVSNQYDGIVAHIPLNEDTASYTGVFLENESGTKTAATAGQFVNRLDGLAGFAKEFDGSDDYLTFADITPPSDEMTIIAHIIPDSGSSGTRTILSKWDGGSDTLNDYELELNSNDQVKFNCLASGGSVMTSVNGPAIPVDGETPTAIMATVDTNAARGNLKLYYNGKLVAQSTVASSGASTSTAWEGGGSISGTSADIASDFPNGVLYVGANANASATRADFFDGRIEEIAIYNRVLYPVVPTSGSYILDRPLYEVDGNFTSPVEYTARLFIKDYHNIRGKTTEEVAASSQISYQKAAFRLNT